MHGEVHDCTAQHGVASQHGVTAQHSRAQHGTAEHNTAQHVIYAKASFSANLAAATVSVLPAMNALLLL